MVVPRVISEVRKSRPDVEHPSRDRPRIAGQLRVYQEGGWVSRHVEVNQGCLMVFSEDRSELQLRLPLRQLNLQPAGLPKTFSLGSCQQLPLAVFKAGSQHQYDRWVKVLAVELLRQTSLEDIKFLDILAITATLGQAQEERGRARSRGVQSRRSHLSPESDREVAALLAKCQQVESYVSVREKRRLFESLSRSNQRLAQSTDNLYTEELVPPEICGKKRAHSLHDLSRSSVAVKEMCRYFEERGQQDNVSRPNNVPELNNAFLSRRNAQRWERRLTRLKQQVADSEDRIWRLQGKMAGLDHQRESTSLSRPRLRGRDVRGYSVLERRLSEEEAKLNQLHEGASRALREVEHSSAKFETALIQ